MSELRPGSDSRPYQVVLPGNRRAGRGSGVHSTMQMELTHLTGVYFRPHSLNIRLNCTYEAESTGQMFKSDLNPLLALDIVTNLEKIGLIIFIVMESDSVRAL